MGSAPPLAFVSGAHAGVINASHEPFSGIQILGGQHGGLSFSEDLRALLALGQATVSAADGAYVTIGPNTTAADPGNVISSFSGIGSLIA